MTWTDGLTKLLTVLAVVALPVTIHAQRETIPEALARGSSGRVRTAPSGHPPDIADLLRDTDIVVRGIVGEARSYLSDDQRDVYTDYRIDNPVFLYQAQSVPSARPGVMPTVTVTQLGGTVTINDRKFTQTEQGLPPLESGAEGLFLLERVDNHYRIVGTFYGAFGIVGGTLRPLTKVQSFAPEYKDVAAAPAAEEMVTRLRALRPSR